MTTELKVINKHDPRAFYLIQQARTNYVSNAEQVRLGVQNFCDRADFRACMIRYADFYLSG